MVAEIEYRGRTYPTREARWLKGRPAVVITGGFFNYPPDIENMSECKVYVLDDLSDVADLQLRFYEPPSTLPYGIAARTDA